MKLYVTVGSWQSTVNYGWINFNSVANQAGVNYLIDQNYATCYSGQGCFTGEYSWWTSSSGANVPASKNGEAMQSASCSSGGSNCFAGDAASMMLNDKVNLMAVWPASFTSGNFLDPTGFQPSGSDWQTEMQTFLQS